MLRRTRAEANHVLTNILGLIPARGGSKGFPGKNIALLAGRPLLSYTCDAALGCRALTRVILSTDDEDIAQVGRQRGVEVPFRRPAALGRDDTTSCAVAQHAIRWLMMHEGWQTHVLVLLQPTSPLRRSEHIAEALDTLEKHDADTVVSVVNLPHRYSPYSIMQVRDGCLLDFWQESLPFDRFRRQNHPELYARNGPAVLASRTEVLLNHDSLYGKKVMPYCMTERDSVDIDTPSDLRLAEWLMAQSPSQGEACAE